MKKIIVDTSELKHTSFYEKFIEKAQKGEQVGGSYIYRENVPEKVRTKGGQTIVTRYKYYYITDMLKDSADKLLKNIQKFFFKGKEEEVKKIDEAYTKENIKKDYGADKKTWFQHCMEYFSHKSIWDKRFADKEKAKKFEKPIKQEVAEKISTEGMETTAEKPAKTVKTEKKEKLWKPNPSLMRKVWSLYTGKEQKQEEKQIETINEVLEKPIDTKTSSEQWLMDNERIYLKQSETDPKTLQIWRKMTNSKNSVMLGNVSKVGDEVRIVTSSNFFDNWKETKENLTNIYNSTFEQKENNKGGNGGDEPPKNNKRKKFSDLSDEEKSIQAEQIKNNIVTTIDKDSVPYNNDGAYDKAAKNWLEKNNIGNAQSIIGEIIINKKSVERDMHHGDKKDLYLKLQTLPAVKDVLEKGTYLGYERDFEGKNISNHYFAAKIKYGEDEKIVFCRVRETDGSEERFYVHEIFTEDEIKKEANQVPTVGRLPQLTGKPLYKYILQDVLNVNENLEHGNKIAMLGNQNAKKYGFKESDIEPLKQLLNEYTIENGEEKEISLELYRDERWQKPQKILQKYFAEKNNTKPSQVGFSDIQLALYEIFNEHQENLKNERTKDTRRYDGNNPRIEQSGLSNFNEPILNGNNETIGNQNVFDTEDGSNSNEYVFSSSESGERFGEREFEHVGRLGKAAAKKIRAKCREILQKKDSEITAEDKEILRNYEGAGGLNEGNQTDAAVLSEFYTPRDVIKKVWEIVDKYNPNKDKKVIEPSAGTGRFAEGRDEDFTLCELDETSARIAKLLHPQAEVKQGAFQKLFMQNNAVMKDYKGEKYDVAVGNPPYGEYTGRYKGMGEGSSHTRYEEYFIDRTLDTLKDDGIMAFVVPSGFLRNGKSKAKEIIASKGKLLEAWRLPKGTFSSTDVGTDIVVLRKEKGNVEDFCNNKYFTDNETHVIGTESNTGNWGSVVVNLPEGKTVTDAINMIDTQSVEVDKQISLIAEKVQTKQIEPKTVNQNLSMGDEIETEKGKGKVTGFMSRKGKTVGYIARVNGERVEIPLEVSEAEEHQNRSDAMKGNQNAKKAFTKQKETKAKKGDTYTPSEGHIMSSSEFSKKMGKDVKEEDIKFWKKTNWEGTIDYSDLTKEELAEIRANDNFIEDDSGVFIPVATFASGNIYEKLDNLETDDPNYEYKKSLLEAALPEKKELKDVTLGVTANFAKSIFDDEGKSLVDKFLFDYIGFNRHGSQYGIKLSSNELEDNMSWQDVWDYVHQTPVKSERATARDPVEKQIQQEENKMIAEQKKQKRREVTERLFNEFVRNLPDEERNRITDLWNRRFNAFVNPDFNKVPLLVDGLCTHKGEKEFTPTDQQIKGITALCNKGNGILAYDVGVGKTFCGIVAAVNQLQTGKAKHPTIMVPKSVYKKWIKEIHQHFPDIPVTELGNFSEKDLKKYRDEEGNFNFPENCLKICTYEGLQKITFKDSTLDGELLDDMLDSQSIFDYDENGNLVADTRSEREKATAKEKIEKLLGKTAKAKEGAVYWEDLGIDNITVDECFPYNTKVLTEKGWCEIGRLVDAKVERVYSYNCDTKEIELKRITAFMPKELKHKVVKLNLSNGGYLVCTHNHKIFVEGEGYVEAENTVGKKVSVLSESILRGIQTKKQKVLFSNLFSKESYKRKTKKNLSDLSEGISIQKFWRESKLKKDFLFNSLLRYIQKSESRDKEEGKRESLCYGGCFEREKNARTLSKNERKQSHEKSRIQTKSNQFKKRDEIQTAWWKWETDKTSNSIINYLTSISCGISNKNCGCKEFYDRKDTSLLQTRFGIFRNKTSDRVRWIFSQFSKNKTVRQEERNLFNTVRVESVEILEPRSFAKYGFRNSSDKTVYDITVEDNHNFIAEGMLVSNCHNFKNVFSIPRNIGKSSRFTNEKQKDYWGRSIKSNDDEGRLSNEFQGLSGVSSSRGMKMFAISQLIQRENNGRGFFGLSATPFNNSPIEIYNILSLCARNRLKDLGIYNMQDFLREFAELKPDWKVSASGNVEQSQTMKNFKNLSALQNLITEFIDKVDGEEAGVIRPRKQTHRPTLDLTPLQKQIIECEKMRMDGRFAKGKDNGKPTGDVLIAMNNMRMATLSPSLVDPKFFSDYEQIFPDIKRPKLDEIVTASPKLQFTCDCVVKQYKDRPSEGQVIYMPRGVEQYEFVRDYLVKKGMPKDSIAFMDSSTSLDKKEQIKEDFNNPDGKIKVIIGSETIKEGVSLNGNSTTLYNSFLGWNPTETIQVEGRIWRQGNKQGITHIVYPLMNDSIDSMMMQKYDEKSSRINAIWSYKGNSLNVEDYDPEEVKFALIKDPAKRADFQIKQKTAELKKEVRLLGLLYDKLYYAKRDYDNAQRRLQSSQADIGYYTERVEEGKTAYENAKKEVDKAKKSLTVAKKSKDEDLISLTEKELKNAQEKLQDFKDNYDRAKSELRNEENYIKKQENELQSLELFFSKQGTSYENIDNKLSDLSQKRTNTETEIKNIEDKKKEYIQQAKEQIEKEEAQMSHDSVETVVNNVTSTIGKNLRIMDAKMKEEIGEELKQRFPHLRKSIPLFFVKDGRFYIRKM